MANIQFSAAMVDPDIAPHPFKIRFPNLWTAAPARHGYDCPSMLLSDVMLVNVSHICARGGFATLDCISMYSIEKSVSVSDSIMLTKSRAGTDRHDEQFKNIVDTALLPCRFSGPGRAVAQQGLPTQIPGRIEH